MSIPEPHAAIPRHPRRRWDALGVAVATAGGVGTLRPAAGTWGTAAALAVAVPWILFAPPAWMDAGLWLGAIAASLAGLASCGAAIRHYGVGDPSSVVIDEVAGTWLALAVMPAGAIAAEPWLALVAAGLAFRLFDIAKPWPLSRLEHLPGAWGILADDLAAGLLAGMLATAVLH